MRACDADGERDAEGVRVGDELDAPVALLLAERVAVAVGEIVTACVHVPLCEVDPP